MTGRSSIEPALLSSEQERHGGGLQHFAGSLADSPVMVCMILGSTLPEAGKKRFKSDWFGGLVIGI